jgi:Ca2+-binding RTX toxin-like protein
MRSASLLVIALILFAVSPAHAGTSDVCTFDEPSATVTVSGQSSNAVLARSGDAIILGADECGSATVTNTDLIDIQGDIQIALWSGPFAPGQTDEGDGSSEIEFVVRGQISVFLYGNEGPDHWAIRSGSDPVRPELATTEMNLNAEEASPDVDVVLEDASLVYVAPGAGSDVVETLGSWGVFRTHEGSVVAAMDEGDDTLLGVADVTTGDEGIDTVDLRWAPADHLGLIALGDDALAVAGSVINEEGSIGGFERAIGHDGEDILVGSDLADVIRGRGGSDQILASGGPDLVRAGPGDDDVRGNAGNDVLIGGRGADSLRGGRGSDRCDEDPADVVVTSCA